MRDVRVALKKAGLPWPPPTKKQQRAQRKKVRPDVTADDWVITFAFDVDPSMELMDLWEGKLERRDGAVSRVPGRGVEVTVYAPGALAMFDAAEKMAVEVVDTVRAEPTGVDIVREQEHRRRADAYTMPELMSAAEIAVELGVARQRVHQLRSTAAFPAPLAELRGGAVWDAAAVRKFAWEWERKLGRPPRQGAAPRHATALRCLAEQTRSDESSVGRQSSMRA